MNTDVLEFAMGLIQDQAMKDGEITDEAIFDAVVVTGAHFRLDEEARFNLKLDLLEMVEADFTEDNPGAYDNSSAYEDRAYGIQYQHACGYHD